MVQPIGTTNATNVKQDIMNVETVKNAVRGAFSTYGYEDSTQHNKYMRVFYTEGKKNPCVARMIMPRVIIKSAEEESDTFQKTYERDVQPHVDAVKETPAYTLEDYGKKPGTILKGEVTRTKADVAIFSQAMHAERAEMGGKLQGDVVQLRDEFNEEFKRQYPKTWRIRDRLIRDYGVFYDRPTVPKRSILQKLQIVAPKGGYKSIYPKTLETRARLLVHNRLGEKGKMSPWKKKLWNNPIFREIDRRRICTSLLKYL